MAHRDLPSGTIPGLRLVEPGPIGRISSGDSSVISALHQTRSLAFQEEAQEAYAGVLKNLGRYYLIFEDLDSADHYLRKGLAQPLEDTASSMRASTLMYYGVAAEKSGLLELAYLRYQWGFEHS